MTAAKEELHVFSLAAFRLLDEKPHLGHRLSTAVLHSGIGSVISITATGLAVSLYVFRGGPRCTGQDRDQETSLDWFQVRSMSGAAGRFQSVDPGNAGADAGDPQTWNGYSYVGNNPMSFTDPSGMLTQADGGGDGGGWGGLFVVGAEALYDGIKHFFSSGARPRSWQC